MKKILIILRGISGIGKSTFAKQIVDKGIILSADDKMMVKHPDKNVLQYEFDPKKLAENHQKTQKEAEEAAKSGISPIIIDNTNLDVSSIYPYWKIAKNNGYDFKIFNPGDWEDGLTHNGRPINWQNITNEMADSILKQIMQRQEKRKLINNQYIGEPVIRRFIDKVRSIPKITEKDLEIHHANMTNSFKNFVKTD